MFNINSSLSELGFQRGLGKGGGEVVGRVRKIFCAGYSSHGVAGAADVPGAWLIGFGWHGVADAGDVAGDRLKGLGLAWCCGCFGCSRRSLPNRLWFGLRARGWEWEMGMGGRGGHGEQGIM